VALVRDLWPALECLNPDLPASAREQAILSKEAYFCLEETILGVILP
jgi:hypothetical protein